MFKVTNAPQFYVGKTCAPLPRSSRNPTIITLFSPLLTHNNTGCDIQHCRL